MIASSKKELHEKIAASENEVTSIKVTLENVTNRNIKMIAEGHLGLNKRLDDAIRASNEEKMLIIRVNVLEDEVRRIKEQLTPIA